MPNRPFSSLCMKWLSVLMYERNSSRIQIFAAICSTVDYKRYYQSMSLFAFVYWKRDEQETWLVIFFFFFCSLRLKQISSCCIFPLEDFKLRVITTVSLLYTTDWVRPPRLPNHGHILQPRLGDLRGKMCVRMRPQQNMVWKVPSMQHLFCWTKCHFQ